MSTLETLREKSQNYAKEEAQKIIDWMVKYDKTTHSVATCDGSNWDRELHRQFPNIAKELRKHNLSVTSSVNWGVTDWVISV